VIGNLANYTLNSSPFVCFNQVQETRFKQAQDGEVCLCEGNRDRLRRRFKHSWFRLKWVEVAMNNFNHVRNKYMRPKFGPFQTFRGYFAAALLSASFVGLAYFVLSARAFVASRAASQPGTYGSVAAPTAEFPATHWETTEPSAVGMDPAKLSQALATLPSPAVVIRHGKIVAVKGDITRCGFIWSASKSLTALIAARLMQQGQLSYDMVVPGSNVPANPVATYRQFLAMTSDFHLSPHSPGNHFAYNNGAVVHYGNHLKNAYFPGKSYEQMLQEAFLTALGAEDPVGYAGHLSGWDGGWSMSTRDLARVGYLVLRDGAWNGQQLLPKSFVSELYQNQIPSTATPSPDGSNQFYNETQLTPHLRGAYSFGFWLPHRGTLYKGQSDTEAVAMSGAFGTTVFISRAKDLVIAAVNTSSVPGEGQLTAASLDLVAKAILDAKPLSASMPALSLSAGSLGVASFTLINADTHQPIPGFNPMPQNAVLNLTTLPTRNLNIRANTAPATVGGVTFRLNGSLIRSEGEAPYALAGDSANRYNAWTPATGAYLLNAVPHDAGGRAGTALNLNFTVVASVTPPPAATPASVSVTGELKKWHNVTLTIAGLDTNEAASPNPFLDYRLNVTFSKAGKSYVVPGYYAADGNAANTGAATGNKWRVHFVPDEEGAWNYAISLRSGAGIAVSSAPGVAASGDGLTGTLTVGGSDKTGRDHRGKGLLRYVGSRYLQFAGNGEYFIKGGADSPENFLAYADFDQTPNFKHRYAPHAADAQAGDPTWQGGKGKNILGALNYLAGKGMNSVYFLTMNVTGDGDDVWPWASKTERFRFDVSKLDQWERVFSHMDAKGLLLHVVTQERENDHLLDGGALGTQRKLYYRELVARFGHHLALVWNLGEENTNSPQQRRDFASYLRGLDPYDHPIVLHNWPGDQGPFTSVLGFGSVEGPSIQVLNPQSTHAETLHWLAESARLGRQWVVTLDEIGPANAGVLPDSHDPNHDGVRKQALWGNLMAGGAGVEWYFGYGYPHNDLNLEDWRSRDNMWNQTRLALEFFRQYLPFTQMTAQDGLTSQTDDYVLAQPGQVYAVYRPNGGAATLNLSGGTYSVQWYNPRTGGGLQNGSLSSVTGPGAKSIGAPPAAGDWVALVRYANGTSPAPAPTPTPTPAPAPAPAPTPSSIAVTSFTLINADTNQPIAGFNSISEGATIRLSELPTRRLNIRANTNPVTVGSVRFDLNGVVRHSLESEAPFALFGDLRGNYNPWTPALGTHQLMASPFTGVGGSGTSGTALTLRFNVTN
jgi:CubicO group peptidase (beta-lactamase class C family)